MAHVRGVAVESLGGLLVRGRYVQVVRLCGVDVLCSVRPRRPEGRPAFVTTPTLEVVYETWPPAARLDPAAVDALRAVCRSLAARAAGLATSDACSGPPPTPDDVLAALPPPPGLVVRQGPRAAGGFAVSGETADGRVTWRLRPRRAGEPGFLGWRLSVDELGDPGPAAREPLKRLVLAQIAAVGDACGLTVPWGPTATCVERLGVDLGAPLAPTLSRLAEPHPGRALDVRVSVPSRCECHCAFCVKRDELQPPLADVVLERARDLALALRPAAVAGAPLSVRLVGDDALRFPALGELLACVTSSDPEDVTLVTPGTTLAEPGVVETLASLPMPFTLVVTLHGPDEASHDRVAGLPGAWARLRRGLERCREAGVRVQIGHVLTAASLADLPRTLAQAAALAESVHLLFFASEPAHHEPDGAGGRVLAAMAPPPAAVRRSLEDHRAAVEATVDVLEGFPLCLVPASLRERVRNDPHSRPDPPPRPPEACARCPQYRTRCPGPDRGLLLVHGDDELRPLDA